MNHIVLVAVVAALQVVVAGASLAQAQSTTTAVDSTAAKPSAPRRPVAMAPT